MTDLAAAGRTSFSNPCVAPGCLAKPANQALKQPARPVTTLAVNGGGRGSGRKADPRLDRGSATSSGSHNV